MNRRVALGEMSASIAHELNQPLGAILNNAAAAELLLKANPPRLQDVAEILEDIKRDDQRASDIIARVRKMLVKAEFEVRSIDLNAAIDETIEPAGRGGGDEGRRAQGRAGSAASAGQRRSDRGEAGHRQPGAQCHGGHDRSARSGAAAADPKPDANRKEAEVSVSDSGPGISAELLPRIFEAFVTSKATGMGLGLAISRTIIETHGGRMRAENGPEGGAIISFTLPFAPAQHA